MSNCSKLKEYIFIRTISSFNFISKQRIVYLVVESCSHRCTAFGKFHQSFGIGFLPGRESATFRFLITLLFVVDQNFPTLVAVIYAVIRPETAPKLCTPFEMFSVKLHAEVLPDTNYNVSTVENGSIFSYQIFARSPGAIRRLIFNYYII